MKAKTPPAPLPPRGDKIRLTNDGRLELVFLGTGAAFSRTRYQSNLLIIKGQNHLLVDLGTRGSMVLHEAGLSVLDVQNLLVTHSHADHIGGLEEWCLMARYAAPLVKGCARGEYKPNLFTSADYAHILWDQSLKGGLQYSEETEPGRHLTLSDYVSLHLGEYLPGYGRPAFQLTVGDGAEAIDLKLMRTNHIPDSSHGWPTAFYSCGVLIDDRVLFSGDTMFDPDLVDGFGSQAEAIFHDCQDFTGGVHASYEELKRLPARLRRKTWLYHLPDRITDRFDPARDGFAGWAVDWRTGRYVF